MPNIDPQFVIKILDCIRSEDIMQLQHSLNANPEWYKWRESYYPYRSFLEIAIATGKAKAARQMFFECYGKNLLIYAIDPIRYAACVENAARRSDVDMLSEIITFSCNFDTTRIFALYPQVVKQACQVAIKNKYRSFVWNMLDIFLTLPLNILKQYIDTDMEWMQWRDARKLNFLQKSIYHNRFDIVDLIFSLYQEKYWPHLIRLLGNDHVNILEKSLYIHHYYFIRLVEYGFDIKEFVRNGKFLDHFSAICEYAIECDDEFVFCNIYPYTDLSRLDLSRAYGKIAVLISRCQDPQAPSALQLACEKNDVRLIISLVRAGFDTSMYRIFDYICEYAIDIDDKEMFVEFMDQATLPQDKLDKATGDIERFLNYRPQKRNNRIPIPTVKECLQDENLKKKLLRLQNDEAYSSDEESSDSDLEEIKWMCDEKEVSVDLGRSEWLFRGVQFSKKYFATADRKNALQENYHAQPISMATKYLQQTRNITFANADQLVRQHLSKLKSNKSHYSPNKKRKNFESEYDELIQDYINSYETLFDQHSKDKKDIMTRYQFPCPYNPFISTLKFSFYGKKISENIYKYILGTAIDLQSQFHPKRRWSTGAFKHRRLGYIEIYAVDKNLHDYVDLDEWKVREKINVKARRDFGEVILESSVPSKCVLGYVVIAIPSFNADWSPQLQKTYGLSKGEYNDYRDRLLSESPKENDDPLTKEIFEKVAKYQIDYFIGKIISKLEQHRQQQQLTQMISAMRISAEKNLQTLSSQSTSTKQSSSTSSSLLSSAGMFSRTSSIYSQSSSSSSTTATNEREIGSSSSGNSQPGFTPK